MLVRLGPRLSPLIEVAMAANDDFESALQASNDASAVLAEADQHLATSLRSVLDGIVEAVREESERAVVEAEASGR